MEFRKLMKQLGITNPPASWKRNFKTSLTTIDKIALPNEQELLNCQTVYNISDLQLKQMSDCRVMILQNENLKLLWHLWYNVLLGTSDCEEEYSVWIVPHSIDKLFPGIFRALVIIAHTPCMFEIMQSRRLPNTFIDDAISAFVSCTGDGFEITGFYGLSSVKMWWLRPFMLGRIVRLGRLQYQISKFSEPYNVYKNEEGKTMVLCNDNDQRYDDTGLESSTGIYHPHFSENVRIITGYGYNQVGRFVPRKIVLDKSRWNLVLSENDDVLSLHIPGQSKISLESVLESFETAKVFFKEYFPEIHFKAFTSYTWLFNTQLKDFLPENSNILVFQGLFTIILKQEDKNFIFDFVFNKQPCALDALVPKNSFQQKILDHAVKGNVMHSGFGFLLL